MKLVHLVALCAATSVAAAQAHQHAHRHAKKHGSPVEKRADYTEVVEGPVVTEYVLNGKVMTPEEVEAGIKNGLYILVPEATTAPAPKPTTTSTVAPAPTTSQKAAEFYQKAASSSKESSSAPPPSTKSADPVPTTTAEPSPVATCAPAKPITTKASSGGSGGSGLNSDFPSGTIKCSDFASVSKYGPVSADWLGLDGWTGIQNVPGYSTGASAISYISTAVKGGNGCAPNSFCSYACPAGYQKLQWPPAQGSTGQSIGGLYCNNDGYLEVSSKTSNKLCGAGVGGVKIQNKLSKNAALCRTDYPGTESETIALDTNPGQTYEVTCPDIKNYYVWNGSGTSAQYYLNNAGVAVEDACQWGSAPTPSNPLFAGNWAPLNIGVGKGADGNIYTSLFPNNPTNSMVTTANGLVAKLNFNVEIVGGTVKCAYKDGQILVNGVNTPAGCTVGGSVTFVLTDA